MSNHNIYIRRFFILSIISILGCQSQEEPAPQTSQHGIKKHFFEQNDAKKNLNQHNNKTNISWCRDVKYNLHGILECLEPITNPNIYGAKVKIAYKNNQFSKLTAYLKHQLHWYSHFQSATDYFKSHKQTIELLEMISPQLLSQVEEVFDKHHQRIFTRFYSKPKNFLIQETLYMQEKVDKYILHVYNKTILVKEKHFDADKQLIFYTNHEYKNNKLFRILLFSPKGKLINNIFPD